jgi:hypothetical protein
MYELVGLVWLAIVLSADPAMAVMPEVIAIFVTGFGWLLQVASRGACRGKVCSERLDALEGECLGSFDTVENNWPPYLDPVCDVPRGRVADAGFDFIFIAANKEIMISGKDCGLLSMEEPEFVSDFLVVSAGSGGGIVSMDN